MTSPANEMHYPKRFLNDCLRSPVCRNQNNSEGDTSVKGYAIVPYIQGVTEPIKRILSNCNIKVALKPYLTLGHIFAKPKDPVKTNQKTHAVYSIPCGDCEKEYLGQSKRQLLCTNTAKRTSKGCFNFRQEKISFSRTCMLHQTRDCVGKL